MRSSHHRNHHARRLLCLTALACFVAGGAAYACTHKAAVPQLPELPAESLEQPAEYGVQQSTLTAAQAQAILKFAKPGYPNVRDGGDPHHTPTCSTRQQFADWFEQVTK